VGQLAHIWTSSQDLGATALPLMQKLQEQSEETVALFVLEGGERMCLVELPSPQPLSFKRGVGFRERISEGASGRAILAFLADSDEDRRRYAAGYGLDIANLVEDLDEVRQRGYSISRHELIQGAVAIAAPFFDHHGKVAGSLGVFGPSVRFDETKIARYAGLVTQASADLSAALGAPARS
jgi:DNA-binding IclR family transcriptional regulator